MATPLGHSIIGYAIARATGVKSPQGIALAVGAANLPDVDLLMGYMANGDLFSLHHEVITHKPAFPLLVGAAAGAIAAGRALLERRAPTPGEVMRPAALATALVGSHVLMDPLPLPYDDMAPRTGSFWEVAFGQAWNAVIDMTFYGGLAFALLERKRLSGRAEPATA
jgi:hypothetical protein